MTRTGKSFKMWGRICLKDMENGSPKLQPSMSVWNRPLKPKAISKSKTKQTDHFSGLHVSARVYLKIVNVLNKVMTKCLRVIFRNQAETALGMLFEQFKKNPVVD